MRRQLFGRRFGLLFSHSEVKAAERRLAAALQKGDWRESNSLTTVPRTAPAPFGFSHQQAGMERLELSKPGLKNLSRDRFAFIPVSVRQTSVCRWFPTASIQQSATNRKVCRTLAMRERRIELLRHSF